MDSLLQSFDEFPGTAVNMFPLWEQPDLAIFRPWWHRGPSRMVVLRIGSGMEACILLSPANPVVHIVMPDPKLYKMEDWAEFLGHELMHAVCFDLFPKLTMEADEVRCEAAALFMEIIFSAQSLSAAEMEEIARTRWSLFPQVAQDIAADALGVIENVENPGTDDYVHGIRCILEGGHGG